MAQYGNVAVRAVEIIHATGVLPEDAWKESARQLINGSESRKKSCPKTVFLTLCEIGAVSGVPTGQYSGGEENKIHTLKILAEIMKDPHIKLDINLWESVTGVGDNGQVDVINTLLIKGMLKLSCDNLGTVSRFP